MVKNATRTEMVTKNKATWHYDYSMMMVLCVIWQRNDIIIVNNAFGDKNNFLPYSGSSNFCSRPRHIDLSLCSNESEVSCLVCIRAIKCHLTATIIVLVACRDATIEGETIKPTAMISLLFVQFWQRYFFCSPISLSSHLTTFIHYFF